MSSLSISPHRISTESSASSALSNNDVEKSKSSNSSGENSLGMAIGCGTGVPGYAASHTSPMGHSRDGRFPNRSLGSLPVSPNEITEMKEKQGCGMRPVVADRPLHYIAFNKNVAQTLGYGHFLDQVAKRLNEETHNNAKDLLTRTAELLSNAYSKNPIDENMQALLNCLPSNIREKYNIKNLLTAAEQKNKQKLVMRALFGPLVEPDYGKLRVPKSGSETTSKAPEILFTPISLMRGGAYRGYLDNLEMVYKEKVTFGLMIEPFTYPIPDKDESAQSHKLGLMAICASGELGYGLYFIHPQCDAVFFDNLCKCIDPLLKKICPLADEKNQPGSSPPDEKINAMITIYWLLAQSTPVERGGSAYARVILEHLSANLRKQGYEYTVPYTKEGVDLWAQAAIQPLDDFMTKFKQKENNPFFDVSATDPQRRVCFEQALQKRVLYRPDANFLDLLSEQRPQAT